jgi:DNA-binding winged helix-turn-helix (wHTH) protein
MDKLIINCRYLLDEQTNQVRDLVECKEYKLEPRLMKLLVILAQRPGELVSRELLIREIWNDYGGAEDGLTQSISGLRKILSDLKKEIIETIPKKGYILHAEISTADDVKATAAKRKARKRTLGYAVSAAFIVVALLLAFKPWNTWKTGDLENKAALPAAGLYTPFDELNEPEPEHYLNTVITMASDSIEYKLVSNGDARPSFYINKRLQTPVEMELHLPLIKQMQAQLWKRREQVEGEQ